MDEKTTKPLAQCWLRILFMAVALMVSSLAAYAQESIPPDPCEDCIAISGTVRTCAGAALPGVTVRVQGQDFGVTRTKVTTATGFFSFPLLPPDTYVVTPIATTGYFFSPQTFVTNESDSVNFTRYRRDNRANFDGDCKTDTSVFDQVPADWVYRSSVTGLTKRTHFGLNGDIITPGDYNGDGKTDFAVFRPSNTSWYISTDGGVSFSGGPFGLSTDIPVARDYNGDGKTDIAVFRPSTGDWHILYSNDNSYHFVHFGQDGDRPVPGDYDGDNKDDVAVFRPSNATWYILRSSDGVVTGGQFGAANDWPVQADYDGDGRTDMAVYNSGFWLIKNSSNGSTRAEAWGLSTDLPVPGDYDGDGTADIAVQRPDTLTWWVVNSSGGTAAIYFPEAGFPIPVGYLTRLY